MLRVPTKRNPLRLLVSGCLAGRPCGMDGSDYGLHAPLRDLLALPTVSIASFCPEEFAMGTPRTTPDIHGGDGHGVLDGKARVLDDNVNGTPASWTAASDGAWASDPTMFYGLAAPTTFANGAPTGGDVTCPYHAASWQNEGVIPSHQNDAAATCSQAGDTHNVSAACVQNYPAWQAMLQ